MLKDRGATECKKEECEKKRVERERVRGVLVEERSKDRTEYEREGVCVE